MSTTVPRMPGSSKPTLVSCVALSRSGREDTAVGASIAWLVWRSPGVSATNLNATYRGLLPRSSSVALPAISRISSTRRRIWRSLAIHSVSRLASRSASRRGTVLPLTLAVPSIYEP